jgi:hypothetical protein
MHENALETREPSCVPRTAKPFFILEVLELKIRERPPSTLRNIDDRPPGGVEAEDSGALTINVKKCQ